MTRKIYKSAMGKTVDLGALILENENTRAVGNMNVNARGDILDSANKVIETKNRQVQKQYKRQATNVSTNTEISTGTLSARRNKQLQDVVEEAPDLEVEIIDQPEESPVVLSEPEPVEVSTPIPRGGLAAAIAKSQAVKQELMKTPRQLAQEKGLKKI